ncbi:MAG: hypothetical protein OXC82_03875 [Rhodobacteraceae bacterium]|nr:hypothetical protein [Paracoccaceae bacterium]MCY4249560.1 hypothetical protein [Paracoccaceae bacterium]
MLLSCQSRSASILSAPAAWDSSRAMVRQNPHRWPGASYPRHSCQRQGQPAGQSEDFEYSVERVGRADQVLAGIARAVGAIGQAIQRRLRMLGKEREKRPDDQWSNPFSL